jgi:hypothetical protein
MAADLRDDAADPADREWEEDAALAPAWAALAVVAGPVDRAAEVVAVDRAVVLASSALRTHRILAVTEWADRAWAEVVDREWADVAVPVDQAAAVVVVDRAVVLASSDLRTHRILAVKQWADRAWAEVVDPDREWAAAVVAVDRAAEAPAALGLPSMKTWAHKAWAADQDFAADAAAVVVVAAVADRIEPISRLCP